MGGFNLAAPWRSIKLTKFGGLFTDADPRSLPPGGSPLCYDCDFQVAGIVQRPGLTKQMTTFSPAIAAGASFQFLDSFDLLGGVRATILQDTSGNIWEELLSNELTATSIYSGILNSARALGEKVNQRAYLPLSNLVSGTDQPRQWDGTHLDRISQVGPGQAPSPPVLGTAGGAIETMFQASGAVTIYNAMWGSQLVPTTSTVAPGTNLFVLFSPASTGNINGVAPGDTVYLSGLPLMGTSTAGQGQNPNGTYTVTAVGTWNGSAGVQEYLVVETQLSQGVWTNSGLSGATYQTAESLLLMKSAAILGLAQAQAASAVSLSGTGLPQAVTEFPILRAPSEGALNITDTALTSDVATYTYTLKSGWAPGWQASFAYSVPNVMIVDPNGNVWRVTTVGTSGSSQPTWPSSPSSGTTETDNTVTWTYVPGGIVPVTVQNSANGSGVFNVSQATIASATPTTFTVSMTAANVSSASESGATATSGVGAAFILNVGATTIGTGNPGTSPIIGTVSQGTAIPVTSSVASAAQTTSVSQISAQIQSVQEQIQRVRSSVPAAAAETAIGSLLQQLASLQQQLAAAESLTSGATAAAAQPTDIAPGQRYAICLFLTRSGYITPASPPVGFVTDVTTNTATFNDLPLGPPNVIARIIAITAANSGVGGPYYWIPADVVTTSLPGLGSGATLTVSATVINDNSSTTTGSLTLSDTVLLASQNVTQLGNNVQQMREIGECVKALSTEGRVIYMGERVKVDEFYNMTFDGGSVGGFPAGWQNNAGSNLTVALATSPIFGQTLKFSNASGSAINPAGTTLANMANIAQAAYQTFAKTPIIQPQNVYSIRATAWVGAAQTAGDLVVELYSPSAATSWSASIALSAMGTSPAEFTVSMGNPSWTAVPSDLLLRVYPTAMANGAVIYVDRIEVYPNDQPVYSSQLAASYVQNPEAVDSVTGIIDLSEKTTDPITNCFRFLDSTYVTTASRTFVLVPTTDEPSFWDIKEVSNRVGCLGPIAGHFGEEYALIASIDGLYLFDGGNHVKISQDIQKLWGLIYWASSSGVWVRNDVDAQRVYVGVPMTTPNQWAPNLAADSTPASPNVVLVCNYLTAPTGAAIASDVPVSVSMFTGQLLFRDERRKWTVWQISSPYGEFITRADGSAPFWVGGDGTSNVNLLDSSAYSDNGGGIHQRYQTYAFADEMSEQNLQLGFVRKNYGYASILIEGAGTFDLTVYPETPSYPYPTTQPAFTLASPATGDTNVPLNETANRLFLDFQGDGKPGSYFGLYQIALAVVPSRLAVTGV